MMNGQADAVVYTPPAGFTGVDQVLYTARDNNGQGCQATVNITVQALVVTPELPATGPNDLSIRLLLIGLLALAVGWTLNRTARLS